MIIKTPLDFKKTLDSEVFSISEIGPIAISVEHEILDIEKELMTDMELVDHNEGFSIISEFAESKKEALDGLQEIGYTLVAIWHSAKYKGALGNVSGIPAVQYLITPQFGYFKIGDELSKRKIHKFDTTCAEAFTDLKIAVVRGEPISVWSLPQVIRMYFENEASWCIVCCATEMLDPDVDREFKEYFEWVKKIPGPPLIDLPGDINKQIKKLTDEVLELEILHPSVTLYLRNALECYTKGLYEPAIIESWKGLIEFLYNLLKQTSLNDLKLQFPVWKPFKSLNELRAKAKDEQLIDAVRVFGFIGNEDAMAFKALKTKRNTCAHPSEHKPNQLETLAFIDELTNRISVIIKK